MTGHLLAVANMKGGVGKTTTVVMLAEAFAAKGARVLVVDLDPQASVSVCLAGEDVLGEMIAKGRTLDAYLALKLVQREKPLLAPRIRGQVSLTTHGGEALDLALLPSGPYLRLVEREIIYELTGRKMSMRAIEGQLWKIFQEEIRPLAGDYDYILFDCAPGISPVTEIGIRCADLVVVTTISDYLSTWGLDAFVQTVWGSNAKHSSKLAPKRLPHILVTRFQRNVRQQIQSLERLRAEARADDAGFHMFETMVPQAAALSEALIPKDPPPTFLGKYGSIYDDVLTPLVAEIKEALHGE